MHGIPASSTNIQYLSGTGRRRRYPSKKPGTVGKKLLNELVRAKREGPSQEAVSIPVSKQILEVFIKNESHLMQIGIFSVDYYDENNRFEVYITESSVTKEIVRQKFPILPPDSVIDLLFCKDITYVHLTAPHAHGRKDGSGVLYKYEERNICLTARHVVT